MIFGGQTEGQGNIFFWGGEACCATTETSKDLLLLHGVSSDQL